LGAAECAVYIQANLNLIKENQRIIDEVKGRFDALGALLFFTTKHRKMRTQTTEGFEVTFALDNLSWFILSYSLKERLEKAGNPIVLNVCGTGMNGDVNGGVSGAGYSTPYRPYSTQTVSSIESLIYTLFFFCKHRFSRTSYATK